MESQFVFWLSKESEGKVQAWCCTPILILDRERLRQEDFEFQVSLNYLASSRPSQNQNREGVALVQFAFLFGHWMLS